MTLKMIDEIFLYTSFSPEDALNNIQTIAWMDHSGIPYSLLKYRDKIQLKDVISAVNTWWEIDENGIIQEPISSFPFIVYSEIYEELDKKPLRKYIQGYDNITNELPTLYALGR